MADPTEMETLNPSDSRTPSDAIGLLDPVQAAEFLAEPAGELRTVETVVGGMRIGVAEKGKYGRSSEDSCGLISNGDSALTLALADGAGGMANAALASRKAVSVGLDMFQPDPATPPITLTDPGDREQARKTVESKLVDLNRQVSEVAGEGATTFVALRAIAIKHEGLHLVEHIVVGDSMAMVLRDGELIRLGVEETEIQRNIDDAVREGKTAYTADQIREQKPNAGSNITNAIGGSEYVHLDERNYGRFEAQPGDVLLLCSDGLLGDYGDEGPMVEVEGVTLYGDDAIKFVLSREDLSAREKAIHLQRIARKTRDDFTAIVVEFEQIALSEERINQLQDEFQKIDSEEKAQYVSLVEPATDINLHKLHSDMPRGIEIENPSGEDAEVAVRLDAGFLDRSLIIFTESDGESNGTLDVEVVDMVMVKYIELKTGVDQAKVIDQLRSHGKVAKATLAQGEKLTLGRKADIIIGQSSNISREHVTVTTDNGISITDNNSIRGTRIDVLSGNYTIL